MKKHAWVDWIMVGQHHERIGHILGITSGTFDLFHSMHLNYLINCAEKCDTLIVGVDSDALVQARKGKSRPIMTASDRAFIIANLRFISQVFIMDTYSDFWAVVANIKPQVIFKSRPFEHSHPEMGDAKVVLVPDLPSEISTSYFIERIRNPT